MPDLPAPPAAPRGRLHYAWFAGILEGRTGDAAELRRVARDINALRSVRLELQIEGGRFSALADEQTVAGDALGESAMAALVRLLQELVDAAADPAAVESTLRCTAVHDDAVVETLFAPVRGEMQCVSRARPVQAGDRERAPRGRATSLLDDFGRGRAVAIALLLLVAASLLVWQSGLLDRLLSADAGRLAVETGPFGDLLAADVEADWGNYVVRVRRGPTYPATAADAARLEAAAATTARRAAVRAVCDGGAIWVRLHGEGGEVLGFAPLELGALLSDDAAVSARLPGRIDARAVQLGLDAGAEPR